MPETRWGVSVPDFAVSSTRRGAQGVNPAVSRRAGPSSARNERRKRLGEPTHATVEVHPFFPRILT